MLIRSQDREDIINMDNIAIITAGQAQNGTYQVGIGNPMQNMHQYSIGRYSTYDEAISVLNMIQSAYRSGNTVFEMPKYGDVDDGDSRNIGRVTLKIDGKEL